MSPFAPPQNLHHVPPHGVHLLPPAFIHGMKGQTVSQVPPNHQGSCAASALVNNFLQAKAQMDGYDASELEPTPIGTMEGGLSIAGSNVIATPPVYGFPPHQLPLAPQPSFPKMVSPVPIVPAARQQQTLAPHPPPPFALANFVPPSVLPMMQAIPAPAPGSHVVPPNMTLLVPESNTNKRAFPSDDLETKNKKNGRRERNREHAKKSRLRKKTVTECLQQSLSELKEENEKIRSFVHEKLRSTYKDGDQTEDIINAYIEKLSNSASNASSDRFVDALKNPQNHILDDDAKALLSKLAKEVHFPGDHFTAIG